jgi:sugar phosphate isomerase/epimerase
LKIGDAAEAAHLTYCTNVHPGESWAEIRSNLETYCTAVKARIAPDEPFGLGLRLPAAAAAQLGELATLRELMEFLRARATYVFTLNGFPYGAFHGRRVKEGVYLPDWHSIERLEYTNQLAELLAALLPEGVRGSISTVPGAFRQAIRSAKDEQRIASQLARHVAHLIDVERRTGRVIRTALEPEPCCLIETLAEAVQFFENRQLSRQTRELLAREADLKVRAADAALRKHLGVCLDLCHAAVEFEDLAGAARALKAAGIAVPKVQISAGLRLARVSERDIERLRPFDDAVYLHQVIERSAAGLRRYTDLAEAFAAFDPGAGPCEWRVHFHVPIFLERMDAFETTREFIEEALRAHREEPITDHFEVETYTFEVLPPEYRDADVITQISRELTWAAKQLRA